jgi:hypothetical protein
MKILKMFWGRMLADPRNNATPLGNLHPPPLPNQARSLGQIRPFRKVTGPYAYDCYYTYIVKIDGIYCEAYVINNTG